MGRICHFIFVFVLFPFLSQNTTSVVTIDAQTTKDSIVIANRQSSNKTVQKYEDFNFPVTSTSSLLMPASFKSYVYSTSNIQTIKPTANTVARELSNTVTDCLPTDTAPPNIRSLRAGTKKIIKLNGPGSELILLRLYIDFILFFFSFILEFRYVPEDLCGVFSPANAPFKRLQTQNIVQDNTEIKKFKSNEDNDLRRKVNY